MLPDLEVKLVVAQGGLDAADDWIAERAGPGDLVLTADIPLAARVLEAGARCLDFRGGEFHQASIGNALAARELNAHLRALGVGGGGPPPFTQRDRSKFASALGAAVGRLARERERRPSPPEG
jgi:uncharacterized protein YaiI (UPF0178 family)